jgi:hypothetical protein
MFFTRKYDRHLHHQLVRIRDELELFPSPSNHPGDKETEQERQWNVR